MDEQNPRVTADDLRGRGDDLRGRGDDAVAGYGDKERSRAESLDEPATTRTREIRAEIAQTRGELSETVNAIQDRLRPAHLASQAASSVKEAAVDKAYEIAESEPVIYARSNPIPTIMVGIGLVGATWLALGGRNGRSYGYGPRSSSWRRRYASRSDYETYSTPRGGGAYRQGRSRASSAEGEYAAGSADAREQFEMARESDYRPSETAGRSRAYRGSAAFPRAGAWQRAWNDNPLLIGAAAALVGAIVGLSVPETEREHQLMGETRDAMLDTVQETVRDKVNQVQQAATDAVNTVQKIATGDTRSSG